MLMPVLQLDEAMFKVLVKELQTKALKYVKGDVEPWCNLSEGEEALVKAAVEFTLSHLIKIKR